MVTTKQVDKTGDRQKYILLQNYERDTFWCGDVCCSVYYQTSACVREHNNKNSDILVDDREQLCCDAQQCLINRFCFVQNCLLGYTAV
jgi:hypothetical protein